MARTGRPHIKATTLDRHPGTLVSQLCEFRKQQLSNGSLIAGNRFNIYKFSGECDDIHRHTLRIQGEQSIREGMEAGMCILCCHGKELARAANADRRRRDLWRGGRAMGKFFRTLVDFYRVLCRTGSGRLVLSM
jgi:hypothetical protein